MKKSRNIAGERCSDSCSSSSAMAIFSGKESGLIRLDGMVKIELDAARTLVDFAELALLQSENPKTRGKWGNKGRRSRKRVNDESSVSEWSKSLEKFKTLRTKPKLKSSDLVQDSSIDDQRRQDKVFQCLITKTVKAELDCDSPGPMSSTSYMSYGGKSKKILAEAEKEARRVRRILANRESARQTIRRRQVLCEELTREASDLAWENENMQREKELVMKEYQSLKDTNNQLKAQIFKTSKADERTPAESVTTNVNTPPSPSVKLPMLVNKRPAFPQFLWPSIMQPVNPQEKEFPPCVNGLIPPFYILPYPWFFSLPDHQNGFHPHPLDSCDLKNIQDDNSNGDQHDEGSSSKVAENTQKYHPNLPKKGKKNVSSSEEVDYVKNLPETSSGFATNGVIFMPSPLKSVKSIVNWNFENGHEPDSGSREENVPSEAISGIESSQEKIQMPDIDKTRKLVDAALARKRRKAITKLKNFRNQKFVDAAEAACEARKSRKEVTKMKNLYNRL